MLGFTKWTSMKWRKHNTRRITVTSSFNKISTDQLGNRVMAKGRRYSTPPPALFYSWLLYRYLKTTWTVFPHRVPLSPWRQVEIIETRDITKLYQFRVKQRSCADVNSPYKRKCWTNFVVSLVNSLIWVFPLSRIFASWSLENPSIRRSMNTAKIACFYNNIVPGKHLPKKNNCPVNGL